MIGTSREPAIELRDVHARRLPARYGWRMQDVFLDHVISRLHSGAYVLDVGSGRNPSVPTQLRPEGTRYVGLDVSAAELLSAPAGAYDELVTHDIARPLPTSDRYDLIVSWQVLEHVSPLSDALENLRCALRPGGTLVAQVSGSFAFFALAARAMPHRLRVVAMNRLLGHPEECKFPVHYDGCWAGRLDSQLNGWTEHKLIPFYRGAAYLSMIRPLQRLYLYYEDAIARRNARNLATHYLILAVR